LINDPIRAARWDRRSFSWRGLFLCLIIATTATSGVGASPLDEGAERYRSYLIEDIGRSLAGTRAMRDRIKAHDLDGAKRAWIEARIGWERSEVFTSGFVPELDQQIDAWPNATHGFHGIEAELFGASRTDARQETDALIAHLMDLQTQIQNIPLEPQRLLNGIARLAFEVGGNKADGGESRLSGTSLNDMQSNADGIELAYRIIFSEALEAGAPQLADAARSGIRRLKAAVKVSALRNLDSEKLREDSEELVAILRAAAPAIGLERPTLEDAAAQ
jgi:iron uptake system component EfeO